MTPHHRNGGPTPVNSTRVGTPRMCASKPSACVCGDTTCRHSPLMCAIEDAFDPLRDRVVYEDEIEAAFHPGTILKPRSAVVPAAFGYLHARRRLGQTHWVVLVAAPPTFEVLSRRMSQWEPGDWRRLMLIAPTPRQGVRQLDRSLLARFRRRSWRVQDLTAAQTASDLRTELQAARECDDPIVVLIDERLSFLAGATEEDGTNPFRSEATAAAVSEALIQAARRDRRIAPVVALHRDPWLRLAAALDSRAIEVRESDLAEAIPWCAALAESECHPVLIMAPRHVRIHREQLREQFVDAQRVTLIVDAGTNRDIGVAGRNGVLLRDWAQVRTNSAAEATRQLQRSLTSGHRLTLWLPAGLEAEDGTALSVEPLPEGPAVAAGRRSSLNDEFPAANVTDDTAVLNKPLRPRLLRWIRRYEQVGDRTRYLWRWCLHGLELTTLSCVESSLREQLCETKLLAVIYGVLLDDVADRDRDRHYLRWLAGATVDRGSRDFSGLSGERKDYAKFTCDLWDEYLSRVEALPRYAEFAELLDYDNRQVVNTMQYSTLVNSDLRVMNRVEHDLYTPHNMQMMTFAMVDVMGSPSFDAAELGLLREAIWHAQCMGRIGNVISTWEREVVDRDFSSGVFARLIEAGFFRATELASAGEEQIRSAVRRGEIEAGFLGEWRAHRAELQAMVGKLRSVNIEQLVNALERLVRMELFSRGLK